MNVIHRRHGEKERQSIENKVNERKHQLQQRPEQVAALIFKVNLKANHHKHTLVSRFMQFDVKQHLHGNTDWSVFEGLENNRNKNNTVIAPCVAV